MPPTRSSGNIITGEGCEAVPPPRKRTGAREVRNPMDTGDVLSAADRFHSMSVTRNAVGASIYSPKPSWKPRESLVVSDIAGALPRGGPAHTRATYHDVADIAGAAPRPLHHGATGHHDGMSVMDIEVVPDAPVIPHKRDLWLTDDIAGTKPNAALPWKQRETLRLDDIDGTRPARCMHEAKGHFDALDVRDINTDGEFKTTRSTNPLAPSYAIDGQIVQDDVSVHTKQPPKARATAFLSLSTEDIEGAQPMTWERTKVGTVRMGQRRAFRETNAIADVPGAQAGTRARGLASLRRVDPNAREYILLDGTALAPDELLVGRSTTSALRTLMAREAALAASTRAGTAPLAPILPGYSSSAEFSASMRHMVRTLDPRDVELEMLRVQLDAARSAHALTPLPLSATSTHKLTRAARGRPREVADALDGVASGSSVALSSEGAALASTALSQQAAAAAESSINEAHASAPSLPMDGKPHGSNGYRSHESASVARASAPPVSHGRTTSSVTSAATGASQRWTDAVNAKMHIVPPPDAFRVRQVARERAAEVDAVRRLA